MWERPRSSLRPHVAAGPFFECVAAQTLQRSSVANPTNMGHMFRLSKLLLTPFVLGTSSKRFESTLIHTRVFVITTLWHCAFSPRGSPAPKPPRGASLLSPCGQQSEVCWPIMALRNVQHRIESGSPSGSPVEPSQSTSLSNTDLSAKVWHAKVAFGAMSDRAPVSSQRHLSQSFIDACRA